MKKIKSEEYSANLGTEKCFQIKDELHQWNPRYTSGLYTNYVFIFFRTDRVVFVACDFSMNQIFLVQVRRKKSTLSEVKLAVIGAPGVGKSGRCFCSSSIFVKDTRYLVFERNIYHLVSVGVQQLFLSCIYSHSPLETCSCAGYTTTLMWNSFFQPWQWDFWQSDT